MIIIVVVVPVVVIVGFAIWFIFSDKLGCCCKSKLRQCKDSCKKKRETSTVTSGADDSSSKPMKNVDEENVKASPKSDQKGAKSATADSTATA